MKQKLNIKDKKIKKLFKKALKDVMIRKTFLISPNRFGEIWHDFLDAINQHSVFHITDYYMSDTYDSHDIEYHCAYMVYNKDDNSLELSNYITEYDGYTDNYTEYFKYSFDKNGNIQRIFKHIDRN